MVTRPYTMARPGRFRPDGNKKPIPMGTRVIIKMAINSLNIVKTGTVLWIEGNRLQKTQ